MNEQLPIYHETRSEYETSLFTTLWSDVDGTQEHPYFGDLSQYDSCPKCGWDRCLVSYSDLASAGVATCKNPTCDIEVKLRG